MMTDDLITYGTTGGIHAAYPDEIASIFVEYYMRQGGSKPIILLNSLKNRIEPQERTLDYIKQYIDFFRQWAYRRADGDKELLQEIDNYIKGLYEWLKQGKAKGQLDDIEHQRLKAQKESLTEKLYDHIPERLLSGGQTSIEQLLDDIEMYEYAVNYPPKPSFKWQNREIERLGLISERIKLVMRLIKKLYSECAAKYHYLHHLQEIVFDIASYTGVLGLSRDKLDWDIVDNNIEEYKRWFNLHLSELKEFRQELRQANKADQERLQEIIIALKRHKESGDKSALPPIRSVSDLLYKYKNQCTEKTVDVIIQLGRAVRNDAGYYSELLNKLSSDEFLEDLEKVKASPENGKSHKSVEEPTEPGQGTATGFMSARKIADKYNLPYEPLRKRLKRFREQNTLNSDAFVESQDRGKRKPKYFYNVQMVASLVKSLNGRKRPSNVHREKN